MLTRKSAVILKISQDLSRIIFISFFLISFVVTKTQWLKWWFNSIYLVCCPLRSSLSVEYRLFVFNQAVRFRSQHGRYPVISLSFCTATYNVGFFVICSKAQTKFFPSKTEILGHERNDIQNPNDFCRNRLLALLFQ